jgi:hypothetical protein
MFNHSTKERIMAHSTLRSTAGRASTRRTFTALGMAALATATLALGACDDPTEVEEHFDMDGFAIFMGTEEIYRYTLSDAVTDTLVLPEGAHDVILIPIDPDGQFILEEEGEHGEDEHPLEITSDDTSILTWAPEAHTGESAHGWIEFHGELNALQEGSTHMQVCVLHEGHCDFEVPAPGVPVTVTVQ